MGERMEVPCYNDGYRVHIIRGSLRAGARTACGATVHHLADWTADRVAVMLGNPCGSTACRVARTVAGEAGAIITKEEQG
jgi:hypothetical protein